MSIYADIIQSPLEYRTARYPGSTVSSSRRPVVTIKWLLESRRQTRFYILARRPQERTDGRDGWLQYRSLPQANGDKWSCTVIASRRASNSRKRGAQLLYCTAIPGTTQYSRPSNGFVCATPRVNKLGETKMLFSPRASSGGGLWRVVNGFEVPVWLYCVAYGTRCTSFVRDGLVAATLSSS